MLKCNPTVNRCTNKIHQDIISSPVVLHPADNPALIISENGTTKPFCIILDKLDPILMVLRLGRRSGKEGAERENGETQSFHLITPSSKTREEQFHIC